MDENDRLLAAVEAREIAEAKAKKATDQWLEAAAREAHKVRKAWALVESRTVPAWDDLALSSQRQLIADARAVADNPEITSEEVYRLFQERLVATGDTEHEDLGTEPPSAEKHVLEKLKEVLAQTTPAKIGK